tara:strand:- start:401 stop:946 length:546 start_codon:yes stop_codon:yes gene_type:complete
MNKKSVLYIFISFSILMGGEISLSISENLINNYLESIGEYKTVSNKNKKIEWEIYNPHVKLNNNEAIFFAKIIYKNGLVNIRKDVKINLKVKYNLKKNIVILFFENSIINMERRNVILGSIDLKDIYEPKLIFNGPNLKNKHFKLNLNKKRKIYIKPDFAEIFIENKKIELIITVSFNEKY